MTIQKQLIEFQKEVEKLEDEAIGIDDAVKHYAKAVKLAHSLQASLSQVQESVLSIQQGAERHAAQ